MASDYLLKTLASGGNPTADAFGARTEQLQQQRNTEQKNQLDEQTRKDNDFLRVAEFASKGNVTEAKYYAQMKGLQVPDEIYNNGLFASAVAEAGKTYPDDPQKAKMFTETFMSMQGDMPTRYMAARQAAGDPISKDDRELAMYTKKLQIDQKFKEKEVDPWKNTKVVGDVLYQRGADGSLVPLTNASSTTKLDIEQERAKVYRERLDALVDFGGNPIPGAAEIARKDADNFANYLLASQGGQGAAVGVDPMAAHNSAVAGQVAQQGANKYQDNVGQGAAPSAARQQLIYDVQQLLIEGTSPQELMTELINMGRPRQEVEMIIQEATGDMR